MSCELRDSWGLSSELWAVNHEQNLVSRDLWAVSKQWAMIYEQNSVSHVMWVVSRESLFLNDLNSVRRESWLVNRMSWVESTETWEYWDVSVVSSKLWVMRKMPLCQLWAVSHKLWAVARDSWANAVSREQWHMSCELRLVSREHYVGLHEQNALSC